MYISVETNSRSDNCCSDYMHYDKLYIDDSGCILMKTKIVRDSKIEELYIFLGNVNMEKDTIRCYSKICNREVKPFDGTIKINDF